ncbi:MAG: phospho-sugar mutase [Clostridia bacterium]|nr:phospho-sugar mutase [Clostridia bacterium]
MYKAEFTKWLSNENLDKGMMAELESIKNDDDAIKERFAMSLSFGTAGLRGIMQAGTNGMNLYTVAQATKGLATLVLESDGAKRGVAIACDTRNNSMYFSKICAEVLAACGIKSYIFDAPRPTPELSFALRELGAIAGINITASHNPKAYNGYKVYWEDGAQLPPDHAKVVSDEIAKTDIFSVERCDFDEGVKNGLIEIIGEEIDNKFLDRILEQRICPEAVAEVADSFKVVYTAIHGTGAALVPKALERAGVKHIITVPEQMVADGNFPTVKVPNPEEKSCFDMARVLAEKNGCDLIIGTDPDADRVGVLVKKADGDYYSFNGNQIGALLSDYIIKYRRKMGTLPENACIIKSIVSSELARAICEKNGVAMVDVLTGFKFIGEKIKEYESTGEHTFILGFEESYGYLAGTYARDKDAVLATLLVTEMAAVYSKEGKNLYDVLMDVFAEYGFFLEKVDNIAMKGLDGLEKTKKLMSDLRAANPKSIGGIDVKFYADYLADKKICGNEITTTGLPKSDVVYFALVDGSTVVVRPSGTEPKVKVYYLVNGKDEAEAEEKLGAVREEFTKILGI